MSQNQFCKHCGANKYGNEFCSSCGKKDGGANAHQQLEMNGMGQSAGPTGSVKIVSASHRWKRAAQCQALFCCNLPVLCHAEELRKRKYVEVYANKLEWNDPYPNPCCCGVGDSHHVLYFDRAIFDKEANKAGCCNPCCELCPTCFDICGEAVLLNEQCCALARGAVKPYRVVSLISVCCPVVMIGGFDDADGLARTINQAAADARAKGNAAPACMSMV